MKAKTEMTKVKHGNEQEQAAINAISRELYLIKQANKSKAEALKRFEPEVDVDEAPFLAGVPFSFELETPAGMRTITGRLRLKNSRNWDLVDIEVHN